ncbi:GL12001 [Drosophila persimilis]|uniref:D-aminoacyl-tRNA deacylase n=2 Tax=pseudoobscura subgroup TaxID=32358 RepID=A0A6I8US83_DROPS|nr:D-aminoacyl-tRNA deacylase [Drosophila pseudoobscura]XP_002019824.1 D-aminoacyl-tRNA deacylase [Drosophila persimilis]EDW38458.1 GL12001 [Drosophila persimilis]
MRAVIQRVRAAKVTVLDELVSSIGPGLCVLVGIKADDTVTDVEYLVRKILALRLFEDEGKRWQKSAKDLQLEILCISQFTLYHRLKGNKPDFSAAMKGDDAQKLYTHFLNRLKQSYDTCKIKDGKFGANMQVHIENDGPVTINLESPDRKQPDEGVDK